MFINEDFFDDQEITVETPEIPNSEEVDTKDYQFQIKCIGIRKEIHYDLNFFEKCLDSFRLIEHSPVVVIYDCEVSFYFNHSMKCAEDLIKFIKILWVATGRETNPDDGTCVKLFPRNGNSLMINISYCGSILLNPIEVVKNKKYVFEQDNSDFNPFYFFAKRIFGENFKHFNILTAMGFVTNKEHCITNTYETILDRMKSITGTQFYHNQENPDQQGIETSFDKIEEIIANKEISSKYIISLVESSQTGNANINVTTYNIDTTFKNALAKTKYGRKIQTGPVLIDFYTSRIILDKKNERKFFIFPLRQKISQDEITTYFFQVQFKNPVMRTNKIDVAPLLISLKARSDDD